MGHLAGVDATMQCVAGRADILVIGWLLKLTFNGCHQPANLKLCLHHTEKYVNIPSEKYIYVHIYVCICVYTYLCKMDERWSYASLSKKMDEYRSYAGLS